MTDLTRRRLLSASGAAAGAALLGACSGGSKDGGEAAVTRPRADSTGPPTVLADVADLSDVPTSTIDPVTGDEAFLIKDDQGVRMLSAVCTHAGCVVAWMAEEGQFVCPCHRATYEASGDVVSGPAPRPLSSLPVKVAGRQVYRER